MTTIATICARGGSVGVPRKNIKLLQGKPLIVHTIEQALECALIDRVFVSTDDAEIAEIAKNAGAEVPYMRPAELATSQAGKIAVIQHLYAYLCDQGLEIDKIVDLDPTSPLRLVSDIESAAAMLDDETDVVITAYKSDKNPYFNMVERKQDGNVQLVCTHENAVLSRQQAPAVYAMNASIYVWHAHTLSKGLWDGRVKLLEMPHLRSVDIDSEIDFMVVEQLMKNRESAKNE